jgi:phosphatidyl-myo-inositol dimannoside synthase
MDSADALTSWPNPTPTRPLGVGANKLAFVTHALSRRGRAKNVIVGHVNQAPVALAAKKLGLIEDYVIVLHGIEAWNRLSWLRRAALRAATTVVATTAYTAKTCARLNDLSPKKFKIIPLCTDPYPSAPDSSFRLDGEWPLLFVARLARSEGAKGLDMLLEAVAQLRRDQYPVKLHVIGDGNDRGRLEMLAASHLLHADGIQFHGRVSNSVLEAAYRSAKTFVMPSAKEGFGLVFLEAMRHGVPCIGGAHGGTPEVFVDGVEGLLVNHGDTSALTGHLRALIKCPERALSLGEAGRVRCSTDYAFETFVCRWKAAIHEDKVLTSGSEDEQSPEHLTRHLR